MGDEKLFLVRSGENSSRKALERMVFIQRRSERCQKSQNIYVWAPQFQWPKALSAFFSGRVCVGIWFQKATNQVQLQCLLFLCLSHHPFETSLTIYETLSYFSTVAPAYMDQGKLARPAVTLEGNNYCPPNILGASRGNGAVGVKLSQHQ